MTRGGSSCRRAPPDPRRRRQGGARPRLVASRVAAACLRDLALGAGAALATVTAAEARRRAPRGAAAGSTSSARDSLPPRRRDASAWRAMSASEATCESMRELGSGTVSDGAAASARRSDGGSMKVTKRREIREPQPIETSIVATGSSMAIEVVTRTMRRPGSRVASRTARTWRAATGLSPAKTWALMQSRGTVSSASSSTLALKSSCWPRVVWVRVGPNPSAIARGENRRIAVPRAEWGESLGIAVVFRSERL